MSSATDSTAQKRRTTSNLIGGALLLLAIVVLWFVTCESLDGDKSRVLQIGNLAGALGQYQEEYGTLPFSPDGSAEAFPRLRQYLYDSVTPERYVLWMGERPWSSHELVNAFGDDFIIAAEAVPVRSRVPPWGHDLRVITSSFTRATIRGRHAGSEVVGTRLADYQVR